MDPSASFVDRRNFHDGLSGSRKKMKPVKVESSVSFADIQDAIRGIILPKRLFMRAKRTSPLVSILRHATEAMMNLPLTKKVA